MIKKTLYLLALGISLQIVSACGFLGGGECGSTSTYTVNYIGVNIDAYNTSGFNPTITTDVAYKNAFGLSIYAESEHLQTASSFSFSLIQQCYALSCASDNYIFSDPIKTVKIYMLDSASTEKIDVTPYFGINSYYEDEFMSIDDFLAARETWHDGFQVELIDYKNIPDKGKFMVELYLESENMFTAQTTEITFI